MAEGADQEIMQTVPERDPQGAAKAEQVEETNRGRDTGEDGQGEFQQSEFHQKACRSILKSMMCGHRCEQSNRRQSHGHAASLRGELEA